MKLEKKNPIIFLITGKSGSGKTTVGKIIESKYLKENKKVVISPYTKYLKLLIEDITNKKITEEEKPRDLLQKLSSELIKKELGKNNFFIDRQLEDLEIYSYFIDIIIIPDVRFKQEIDIIKEKYNNVYVIKVERDNYNNKLTIEQQKDITETALDNYKEYDYKIINNENINQLTKEVLKIVNETKKEGI